MARQGVSLVELCSAINKAIQERGNEIQTDVLKCLDNAKDFALDNIKQTAPRSNRNVAVHLADSFIAEPQNEGLRKSYKIYSKEHGALVHLVEFGFRHYKTKQMVQGRPFLLPTFDKASRKLYEDVYKVINK